MVDKKPTLTQGLRDEIIADIRAMNIPGVSSESIRKMGAFSETKCSILVNVDDNLEVQDIGSTIRLMEVTIYVATYVPQDRDGELLDLASSYVEEYVRTPMRFGEHAGYAQVRTQQMLGASRRMDMYGEQAWLVCAFEMVIPYGKSSFCSSASPSASASPSPNPSV